ncbi:12298_t:CDS:2, partial [Acaulospora morrowiae]
MSSSSTHPTAENSTVNAEETLPSSSGSAVADSKNIQVLNDEAFKAFILQDLETAVEKFSEASELIGQFYGTDSEEYAEALYNYGHALLENSRTQATALGPQAIPQEPTAEIPVETSQVNTSNFVFEGDSDSEDYINNGDEAVGQVERSTTQDPLEEQTDDLSLAWEILEYSREIYSQISSESAKRNLGEVYIKLGDVSLENEKFDQAAIDYREGLRIKKETLSEDNRQIAEAYPFLVLALALESISDTASQEEAIEHVQKAIGVLQKRKEILHDKLSAHQEVLGKGKKVATVEDPTVAIDKEMKDIDELLIDMNSKVEDIKTLISQEQKELNPSELALEEYVKLMSSSTLSELASEATKVSSVDAMKQVNDVTSLIKRKVVTNSSNFADGTTDMIVDNNASDQIQQGEKKRKAEIKSEGDEGNEDNLNKKARQAS